MSSEKHIWSANKILSNIFYKKRRKIKPWNLKFKFVCDVLKLCVAFLDNYSTLAFSLVREVKVELHFIGARLLVQVWNGRHRRLIPFKFGYSLYFFGAPFITQGGNSQNFLQKFLIFFLTLRCSYKAFIRRNSVIYVFLQ